MNLNTILVLFLSLSFSLSLFSQDKFEPGYILLNNGTQIEGLIKNQAWKNTPLEFEYKLDGQEKSQRIEVKEIREISVPQQFKFIRANVMAGFPEEFINDITFERKLKLIPMSLFMEVLVEGELSLYQHKTGENLLFFYQKEGQDIEQLIFKRYKYKSGIQENNRYKQQLWLNARCTPETPISELDALQYSEKSLKKYYSKYYECTAKEAEQIYQNNNGTKLKLNIRLAPGVSLSSLKLRDFDEESNRTDIDFGRQLNLRFGMDFEFVLPYNNGRWALFLEPNLQGFNKTVEANGISYESRYLSLDLPFGLRHYIFLKGGHKLFVNVLIQNQYNLDFDSAIQIGEEPELLTRNGLGIAGGVGYQVDKFGAELRFYGNRNILQNYIDNRAQLNHLPMLVVSYQIK